MHNIGNVALKAYAGLMQNKKFSKKLTPVRIELGISGALV